MKLKLYFSIIITLSGTFAYAQKKLLTVKATSKTVDIRIGKYLAKGVG